MKIVFFDVDDLTKNYIQGKKVCDCEIVMLKESMDILPDDIYQKVKDADVASTFVHAMRFDEKVLSKYPNLKLLSTRSTGFDHIDLDYCKSKNIEVVNVPKYGEATVAEYAFGLLLNVSRKIAVAKEDMEAGKANISKYMGFDLYGRTLGVIGTGAIGRHAVKIARGFGMNVLAYDLYPSEEFSRIYNINYVSLDELYKNSDIITLHAPSTKENYHMLGAGAFEKMKQGVIIINTARGDLIDAEALYKYLKNGRVGGAGLDVLEFEDFLIHDDVFLAQEGGVSKEHAVQTVVNAKLLQLDNVIVTPHIGFNSVDAVHRILDITLSNISSFEAGHTQNSVIKN